MIFTAAMLLLASGDPLSPMASDIDHRSMPVRTSDLDLARADHVARLDRRIATASNRVCGTNNRMPLDEKAARSACVAAARTRARADMRVAIAAAEQRRTRVAAR